MYTTKDRELADFILLRHEIDTKRAAEVICQVAFAWNDAELWKKGIQVCSAKNGTATLPEAYVINTLEWFSWEQVREGFEIMLKNDKHNVSRLDFLKLLESWAADTEADESKADDAKPENGKMEDAKAEGIEDALAKTDEAKPKDAKVEDNNDAREVAAEHHKGTHPSEVRPWVTVQTREVLKSLRPPEKSETNAILDIAKNNGGLTFLKDSILSQPPVCSEPSFLLHFASALFSFQEFPESPEKASIISNILQQSISKATFFKPQPRPPTELYLRAQPVKAPTVSQSALAEQYVSTCIAVGCRDRVSDIIDRVIDVSALSTHDARECAKDLMLPLVAYCDTLRLADPDTAAIHGLDKLRQIGVKIYLDWLSVHASRLTKQDFEKFLDIAVFKGDPQMLLETIIPKLQATKLPDFTLQIIVEGLHKYRTRIVFSINDAEASFNLAIKSFAEKYVSETRLDDAPYIAEVLNWCSDVQQEELAQIVIPRFLNPPTINESYITKILIPLLPEFRKWAVKVNQLDSLAWVFPKIVLPWQEKVLGPPPAHNAALAKRMQGLQQWSCICGDCRKVQAFLKSDPQCALSLDRIGAVRRKHLEKYMSELDKKLVTYTTITTSPQGLKVTKSEALHVLSSWKAKQQEGLDILNSIGRSEREQRHLLGVHYDQIVGAIKGNDSVLQMIAPVHDPSSIPPVASASSSRPKASHPSTAKSKGIRLSDPRPTKKRRKAHTDSSDVIDLT
ncbi:hypothetical protein DENSPDRAFT_291262 [Dentipellis sp. KUC8613]|nr:hypothetical protein DENSPDRAFT_291262 [Dentipellis sp. KUC8613]